MRDIVFALIAWALAVFPVCTLVLVPVLAFAVTRPIAKAGGFISDTPKRMHAAAMVVHATLLGAIVLGLVTWAPDALIVFGICCIGTAKKAVGAWNSDASFDDYRETNGRYMNEGGLMLLDHIAAATKE